MERATQQATIDECSWESGSDCRGDDEATRSRLWRRPYFSINKATHEKTPTRLRRGAWVLATGELPSGRHQNQRSVAGDGERLAVGGDRAEDVPVADHLGDVSGVDRFVVDGSQLVPNARLRVGAASDLEVVHGSQLVDEHVEASLR